MTDAERALWATAQADYKHALAIARDAWKDIGWEVSDIALQAATATVMLHHKELQQRASHRTAAPSTAAPAAVKRDETRGASQASGAVPPRCPKCGGPVWDNRDNKKNPKAPDWKCRDKKCVDDKGFVTGGWIDKPKPNGARGSAHARPTEGYDEMPGGLREEEDSLPF
jgi:hypothetical protein